MFKRAQRLTDVRGFGIDRTAVAADARTAARQDWPVLRMENLDTDLPLPPEAIPETVRGLERPAANSWLPFTGDMDLRAAMSDFLARSHRPPLRPGARDRGHERRHRGDPRRACSPRSTPATRCCSPIPTYAGIVNRVRLAGGVPRLAPYRVQDGEWRLDLDAFAAAAPRRRAGRPDEPVDAVGRRADRGRVGRGLRRSASSTTSRCSTTPRWSGCCSTAASSCTRCASTGWPSAP